MVVGCRESPCRTCTCTDVKESFTFVPMGSRAWNALYEVASTQEGLFTTEQAANAGVSRQLLAVYLGAEDIRRVRRAVYRIVNFPAGDHEQLVELWLWSRQVGVFTHQTALWLHELSDAMPNRIHLTVPPAFRRRPSTIPPVLVLHSGQVPESERTWAGPVPVTSPAQTLSDCVLAHVSPDLVRQAVAQARRRGLVAPDRLARISRLDVTIARRR